MNRRALIIFFTLHSFASAAEPPDAGVAITVAAAGVPLDQLLRSARERNRPYVAPTPSELADFRAGAALVLTRALAGEAASSPALERAGFTVVRTALEGAPAVAVVESRQRRRGGGVYIIRLGAARELLVQVPHSFFDEETLPIGRAVVTAAGARALFVNTVHRYQGGPPPARVADESAASGAPADVAHQPTGFFQAMTEVALERLPTATVLQVHGFSGRADAPTLAVVSPGAARAGSAAAAALCERLRAVLGAGHVLLYPRDTRMLGAQTNVQGAAVARRLGAIFLHVELARPLRDRLRGDGNLLTAVAGAMAGPAR